MRIICSWKILLMSLERIKLNKKIIMEDLSQVDECVTHFIHTLGLSYERCEDKSEIFIKFIFSFSYKDEEKTLNTKQISYPSNPSHHLTRRHHKFEGIYFPCSCLPAASDFTKYLFFCLGFMVLSPLLILLSRGLNQAVVRLSSINQVLVCPILKVLFVRTFCLFYLLRDFRGVQALMLLLA
jgi:hypothetical protein